MNDPRERHRRLAPGNLISLVLYLLFIGAMVWKLYDLRAEMIEQLDNPQSQAQWQQWREESVQPGPVERKMPRSERPPALVLLQDYFPMCLTAALLFGSLVFLVTMLLFRAALRGDTADLPD